MTDPNDPYAPPAPTAPLPVAPPPPAPPAAAHLQQHATQPLPAGPASSDTPADLRRPPVGYMPSAPFAAPPASPYAASPAAPEGYYRNAAPTGPSSEVQPYAPVYRAPRAEAQYYSQPYPVGTYGYPYRPRQTNGMAIAALVLGLLWLYWIGSILALIFGYVALGQIKRTPADAPQDGRGLAIAGVVLGWIGVATLGLVTLIPLMLLASGGY